MAALLFARMALGKAKALAGSMPRWVWYALAAIALLGLGSCVHRHKVKVFGDERYMAGAAAEKAKWIKQIEAEHQAALAWKAKVEAHNAADAAEIRGKHE